MSSPTLYWKKMSGHVLIPYTKKIEFKVLGIAGRDDENVVALIPFFGENDLNYDGESTFKEWIQGKVPFGGPATTFNSPLKALVKATINDPDFTDQHGDDGRQTILSSAQQLHTRLCVVSSSVVIADAYVTLLLGPVLGLVVKQAVKGGLKQFFINQLAKQASKQAVLKTFHIDSQQVRI